MIEVKDFGQYDHSLAMTNKLYRIEAFIQLAHHKFNEYLKDHFEFKELPDLSGFEEQYLNHVNFQRLVLKLESLVQETNSKLKNVLSDIEQDGVFALLKMTLFAIGDTKIHGLRSVLTLESLTLYALSVSIAALDELNARLVSDHTDHKVLTSIDFEGLKSLSSHPLSEESSAVLDNFITNFSMPNKPINTESNDFVLVYILPSLLTVNFYSSDQNLLAYLKVYQNHFKKFHKVSSDGEISDLVKYIQKAKIFDPMGDYFPYEKINEFIHGSLNKGLNSFSTRIFLEKISPDLMGFTKYHFYLPMLPLGMMSIIQEYIRSTIGHFVYRINKEKESGILIEEFTLDMSIDDDLSTVTSILYRNLLLTHKTLHPNLSLGQKAKLKGVKDTLQWMLNVIGINTMHETDHYIDEGLHYYESGRMTPCEEELNSFAINELLLEHPDWSVDLFNPYCKMGLDFHDARSEKVFS